MTRPDTISPPPEVSEEARRIIEQLTQSAMGRCAHFTGSQNRECSAGVTYDDVRITGSLPCLKKYNTRGATCPQLRWPSESEARAEAKVRTAEILETSEAMSRCVKDANGRRGIVGKVECPRCQKSLHYSVAGSNGHIWGKCETQGCISWMQ